jgi:hypothetical protein
LIIIIVGCDISLLRVEMSSHCWLFGMALELDCIMGFSSWCFGTIRGSGRRIPDSFLAGSRLSRS